MDHQPFTVYYFLLLFFFNKNSSQITITAGTTTRKPIEIIRKITDEAAVAAPAITKAKRIESTSLYATTIFTTTTTTWTQKTTTTTSATFQTSSATLTSFLLLVMGSCIGSLLTKDPHSSSAGSLWRQATDEQEAELMSDEETNGKKQKFIYRIIKFKRKQKHKQFMEKFWEHQESNYSQLSTRNGNESISDIQLQNLDVQTLLNSNALAKESVLNATASAAQFSSRTSSSLDLEWEHEYGSNMRSYPPALLPPPPSTKCNAATDADTVAAIQRNQNDLSDSWQFLSQRHYFDEDFMHSYSSSLAPLSESEPTSCTTEQNQNQIKPFNTNSRAIRQMIGSKSMLQQQYPQQVGNQRITYTRTSSRNSCSHISTPESLEWDIDEEQQRQMHVEDDNLGLETLELLHQIEQLKNKVLNETGDGLFDADVEEEDHIEGFTNINADFLEEINIS